MIKNCEQCGTEIVGLSYKCKYCGCFYCLNHQLPENYMCLFLSSKGLVPQKLEVSGTYYQDSDIKKRHQKSKKVLRKKKQKKKKRKN